MVDSAPPPEKAIHGEPPDTATDRATAIAMTVMNASLVALIVTFPAPVIVPAFATNAATELSIELCASARPNDPAPDLPPERLAATVAAWALAVTWEASL